MDYKKHIFCYLLLFIMPLRKIISLVTSIIMFSSISDFQSLMDGSYLTVGNGMITVLSLFGNLLFVAYIIFVVLDIVGISKAGYNITGLVLFAIFLNPGYYIWRAYVLKQKKTVPIIYTVGYSILVAVNMIVSVYYSIQMSFSVMQSVL